MKGLLNCPFYWSTDEPLQTTSDTMSDYLEHVNMLDITLVDGSYAEGVSAAGLKYGIHASGNGDCFNHKVEFELI